MVHYGVRKGDPPSFSAAASPPQQLGGGEHMDFDDVMNSLDFQTAHWVEAVLTNDKTALDDELVAYFMHEGKFTKEEAAVLVSKRSEYLSQ
jgi:hypothetical protein